MAKNSGPNKPPGGTPGVNGQPLNEFEERMHQWRLEHQQLSGAEIDVWAAIDTKESETTSVRQQQDLAVLNDALYAIESSRLQRVTQKHMGPMQTLAGSHRSRARVATLTGRSDTYVAARNLTRTPSNQLHANIGHRQQQLGTLREELQDIQANTQGEADEDTVNRIGGITDQMYGLERGIAVDRAALREQKRLKLDPQGRTRRAEELLGHSGSYLEQKSLQQRAASGELGTLAENEQKYAAQQTKFGQVDRFRVRAEERQSKNLEKINALYDKHADKLENLGNIIDVLRRGGGGGGIGGKLMAYGQGIGAAVGSALPVAQATNEYFTFSELQVPMQSMQIRAGIADRYNKQYNNAESALAGDPAAMGRLLHTDAFKQQFAQQMYQRQQEERGRTQGIMNVAGAGLMIGGGAVLTATGLGAAAGIPMTAAGVGMVGGGGAMMLRGAKTGLDIAEGVTAGKTMLTGYDIAERYTEAMQKIPWGAQQAYMNQFVTGGDITRGFGGKRESMMKSLMSKNLLRQAASIGMSPEDLLPLTNQARTGVGAGQFGASDLLGAGAWARGGVLQGQEFIGNLGKLSGVGGEGADLESILRRAVESGMDNSKNVGQMVQATTQMASKDAKLGLQTMSGVSDVMWRSIQDSTLPPNMRAAVAAGAMGAADSVIGGMNMDIFSQKKIARLAKSFSGAEWHQLVGIADIDTAGMESIRAGAAAENQLAGMNLDPLMQTREQRAQVQALQGTVARGKDVARRTGVSGLLMDASGNFNMGKIQTARGDKYRSGFEDIFNPMLFKRGDINAAWQYIQGGLDTLPEGYSQTKMDDIIGRATKQAGVPFEAVSKFMINPTAIKEGGVPALDEYTGAREFQRTSHARFREKEKFEAGQQLFNNLFSIDEMTGDDSGIMSPMYRDFQDATRDSFTVDKHSERIKSGARDMEVPGNVFETDAKEFHSGMKELSEGIKTFNAVMKEIDADRVSSSLKRQNVGRDYTFNTPH